MKWYYIQFDNNWVTCKNHGCKAEYTLESIKNRRKCPACKMNSRGEIKPKVVGRVMMVVDVEDVIKLNDGDIYEVTGVISDREQVYFYQGGNEVSVSFSEIDALYKVQ